MNAPAHVPALVVTLTTEALRDLVAGVVAGVVADALAEHAAAAQPPAVLVGPIEMARRLDVSRATMHRLRREGCPAVAIGDTFKYEPPAVLVWLRDRRAV